MRFLYRSIVISAALLGVVAPAFAESVTVTSQPDGTVVINGQRCRIVTRHADAGTGTGSNSTTITTGPGGISGTTTISPGGSGSSVTVGSGSSVNGAQSSSTVGSDCVIYRNAPAGK